MKLTNRKGISMGINTIIILLVMVLVMAVVLSFVLTTSKPAESEIKMRGEFDEKCTSMDCRQLFFDTRIHELCNKLWGEKQPDPCVRTHCAKCKNANALGSSQELIQASYIDLDAIAKSMGG